MTLNLNNEEVSILCYLVYQWTVSIGTLLSKLSCNSIQRKVYFFYSKLSPNDTAKKGLFWLIHRPLPINQEMRRKNNVCLNTCLSMV